MATRLVEKVRVEEKKEEVRDKSVNDKPIRKNRALHSISSNDGAKDKQISAKVNGNVYAMFSEINKAQGISNNSALNMILTKYVRENRGILDEE